MGLLSVVFMEPARYKPVKVSRPTAPGGSVGARCTDLVE
jgi:hypothetical protein